MKSGVGAGDEVITTPMTFAASVNVIEHVGARAVLVDIEPDTINIDPARVEAAVTPRTKAILVVHFRRSSRRTRSIRDIANRLGLTIIEDAAHAIPAKYRGRYIGASDNPVAFSFYATKNLTTAEGGMLTGDPALVDRARIASLHGMSRDAWKRYDKGASWLRDIAAGFKYNMTDIQAAMGLCQLRKLAGFQQVRRERLAAYHRAFSESEALISPGRAGRR